MVAEDTASASVIAGLIGEFDRLIKDLMVFVMGLGRRVKEYYGQKDVGPRRSYRSMRLEQISFSIKT
jgi:hypothetical protein